MDSKPESAAEAGTPRRMVLAAVSGVGLTLAGCSTYGGTDTAASSTPPPPASSAPEPSETESESASPTESAAPSPSATPSAAPPANALAKVSDIPVGGGKIFGDQKVVVTQPKAGTIKAFSAVCTHAGCVVGSVAKTIDCPCHGSKFSIEDGSVVDPPANSPLAKVNVSVQGDSIVLG